MCVRRQSGSSGRTSPAQQSTALARGDSCPAIEVNTKAFEKELHRLLGKSTVGDMLLFTKELGWSETTTATFVGSCLVSGISD